MGQNWVYEKGQLERLSREVVTALNLTESKKFSALRHMVCFLALSCAGPGSGLG